MSEPFPSYEQLKAGWLQMQAERDRLQAALRTVVAKSKCLDAIQIANEALAGAADDKGPKPDETILEWHERQR